MAIPLDLLLRLPPALRSSVVTTASFRPSTHLQWLPKRPFSSTSTRLARHTTRPPKPTHTTSRPGIKATKPTPPSPPPVSRTSQPQIPSRPPSTPPEPPIRPEVFGQLTKVPTLLLYRAPSHLSLQISSLLLGTAGVIATYQQALLARTDPGDPATGRPERKVPWYLRSIWLFVGLCYAMASARAYMAPLKIIKRISVTTQPSTAPLESITQAGKGIFLRFEMRHPVPFVRRGGVVIETPVKGVSLDSEVQSHDLSYMNIPVPEATAWTVVAAEKPNAKGEPMPHSTVETVPDTQGELKADAEAKLSTKLQQADIQNKQSIWTTMKQDIRRIFYREGMAYVRIPGKGNWKLDLAGCQILDHGRVLEEAMNVEQRIQIEQSWVARLQALLRMRRG